MFRDANPLDSMITVVWLASCLYELAGCFAFGWSRGWLQDGASTVLISTGFKPSEMLLM